MCAGGGSRVLVSRPAPPPQVLWGRVPGTGVTPPPMSCVRTESVGRGVPESEERGKVDVDGTLVFDTGPGTDPSIGNRTPVGSADSPLCQGEVKK